MTCVTILNRDAYSRCNEKHDRDRDSFCDRGSDRFFNVTVTVTATFTVIITMTVTVTITQASMLLFSCVTL